MAGGYFGWLVLNGVLVLRHSFAGYSEETHWLEGMQETD